MKKSSLLYYFLTEYGSLHKFSDRTDICTLVKQFLKACALCIFVTLIGALIISIAISIPYLGIMYLLTGYLGIVELSPLLLLSGAGYLILGISYLYYKVSNIINNIEYIKKVKELKLAYKAFKDKTCYIIKIED